MAARILRLLDRAQQEIVLMGGLLVSVLEVAAVLVPRGLVRTAAQIAAPFLVAIVQRARVIPVAAVEQLAALHHHPNKEKPL